MNKIVFIGNGFDLAHGLKTSYADLMEFIKTDANLESRKPSDCGNIHYDSTLGNDFICFNYVSGRGNESRYKFSTCRKKRSIYFNSLFKEYDKYQKWVDLESLYFELLKSYKSELDNVNLINKEFEYLKKILHDYLLKEVENKLPENHNFFRECYFLDKNEDKLLGVINFNYTRKTLRYHLGYINSFEKDFYHNNFLSLNIHGELNSSRNPIIFGYGDDNSKEYKEIQNLENNILLKNFKTFQYLRTSNYEKTLSLLELGKDIKIEIIGHSCGLSDKTLLRTIFQHPNVKKIKYRYHDNEEKYFENLYNLSRIFDDNELMRKKVMSLRDTEIINPISFN